MYVCMLDMYNIRATLSIPVSDDAVGIFHFLMENLNIIFPSLQLFWMIFFYKYIHFGYIIHAYIDIRHGTYEKICFISSVV